MSQAIVNGLTLGLAYAILSVGFALLYGVMGVLNFAHGELMTLGAYVAVAFSQFGSGLGWYVTGVLTALLVGLLLGTGVDQFIFRPLRPRGPFATLLSTIALSVILISLFILFGGDGAWSVRTSLTDALLHAPGGASISLQRIVVAATAAAMLVGTFWVLGRTNTGRQVRAVAEHRETAALSGINVEWIMTGVTGLSFMLATVAGALAAPLFAVSPLFGTDLILRIFAIVVIGGLGNVSGAAIAAVLFGLIESVAALYMAPQWVSTLTFGLLILALIVKPESLLRSGPARRTNRKRAVTGAGASA